MAPNDKPKVVDFDHDTVVDYKTDAARYAKLAELGRQKTAELKTQQDELNDKYTKAISKEMDADKAVAEADNAVKLETRNIASIDRQKAELADQADKARQAGDETKASELDIQSQQLDHDMTQAQQRLAEYQTAQTERVQTQADAKQESDALGVQSTQLDGQMTRLKNAQTTYENAADHFDAADRNQTLKNVAAGGDADQIRQSVLAEADHLSDKFHSVADQQAKVYEQYQAADSELKTLKAEEDISQREQNKLQDQINTAKQAGHTDEADSLQRELDWRTARTNSLHDQQVMKGGDVADLAAKNQALHEQAQAIRKDADDLRNSARNDPAALEKKFGDRQAQSDQDAQTAKPADDSADAQTAKQLEDGTDVTPSDADHANDPMYDPDAASSMNDPAAGGIDDTDTDATASADATATASADAPAHADASDPAASVDDLDAPAATTTDATASTDNGTAAATEAASADTAPTIVDDEMLQPATASVPDGATDETASFTQGDGNAEAAAALNGAADDSSATPAPDTDAGYQEPDVDTNEYQEPVAEQDDVGGYTPPEDTQDQVDDQASAPADVDVDVS